MTEDSGLLHLSEVSIAETKRKKRKKNYIGKAWLGQCYDQEILHGNDKFVRNFVSGGPFLSSGVMMTGVRDACSELYGDRDTTQSPGRFIHSCAESGFTIYRSISSRCYVHAIAEELGKRHAYGANDRNCCYCL